MKRYENTMRLLKPNSQLMTEGELAIETTQVMIDFLQNQSGSDVVEQKAALVNLVSPSSNTGYFTSGESGENLVLRGEIINSPENVIALKNILLNVIPENVTLTEQLVVNSNNELGFYQNLYNGLYNERVEQAFTISDLQEKIDAKFNSKIGWLKSRMNNYVDGYLNFASPIIGNITTTLGYFPTNLLASPDQLDFSAANTNGQYINIQQITLFIGHITLLCVILFINFTAVFIKTLNDIDTIFGSIVEVLAESPSVLNLRNEYRKKACIQCVGLLEYTFKCINIKTILRLLFSQVGILGTITTMIIFIAIFRNQTQLFNWIYVLFFKVLLLIVETTENTGKTTDLIFINSQSSGISGTVESMGDISYTTLPEKAQYIIDLTANNTNMIISEASNFYKNVMVAFPLVCANISHQVFNSNISSFQQVITEKFEETVTSVAKYTSDIALGNMALDYSRIVIENILFGTFAFTRAVNQLSVFAALLIVNEDDNGLMNNKYGIEALRSDVTDTRNSNVFVSKVDQQLAIPIILTEEVYKLYSSPFTKDMNIEKIHMNFLSRNMFIIPQPSLRNQLSVNPRYVTKVSEFIATAADKNKDVKSKELRQIFATSMDGSAVKNTGTLSLLNESDVAIIPTMEPVYQSSSYNQPSELGLARIPLQLSSKSVVGSINTAGGIILKCVLPEEDLINLIQDVNYIGSVINKYYFYNKIDTTTRGEILNLNYTESNLDILRSEIRQRAQDIKDANSEITSQTMQSYQSMIKIGVVIAGGAAIFYVAPSSLGLAAPFYPPLYNANVTGMQLVGSVGYRGSGTASSASYIGFNYVFFPTARFGLYMLTKFADSLSKKTTGDIGAQQVVFGDNSVYLSFGGSIEPIINTNIPYYDAVAPTVERNMYAIGYNLSQKSDKLIDLILSNPNYITGFATVILASNSGFSLENTLNVRNKPNMEDLRNTPLNNTTVNNRQNYPTEQLFVTNQPQQVNTNPQVMANPQQVNTNPQVMANPQVTKLRETTNTKDDGSSGWFFGGSKKTQKRRKKSTRRGNKKVGKKRKSNKKKGSNKNKKHIRSRKY
jgi:hypothetical protein